MKALLFLLLLVPMSASAQGICSELLAFIDADIAVAHALRNAVRADDTVADRFRLGVGLNRPQEILVETFLTPAVQRDMTETLFSELVEVLQALKKVGEDITHLETGASRDGIDQEILSLFNAETGQSLTFSTAQECSQRIFEVAAELKDDARVPGIYRVVLKAYPKTIQPSEAFIELVSSLDILFCDGGYLY